ncbi:hypothetical protein SKAU_G00279850 [Synaphobranchus kaupii]|uniref:Uncharacterized protein n=1 Tax=Synaphobranchus kaupii TaxID=118154 RepID=A0A9Q1IMX0_SYNKA|nr:hypothetical protein SKAU_G00279850 [Synaphobranchus kaupii]
MSIKTTLIHWHNKRLKRQECSILLQGDNLPASIPVAPAPLPPVLVRPTAAPPQPGPQHQYHLPRSTAGQAVVKRKSAALAQHPHPPPSVRPRLQAQRQLFPQQAPPPTSAPLPVVPDPTPVIGPFVFLTPQVPAAKLIAPAGPLVAPPPARRAYNRTVDQNKCVKCHQPKQRRQRNHSASVKRSECGHFKCSNGMERALLREMEELERTIGELTRRKARKAGAITSPEWQIPAVRVSRRPDGFSGRQEDPASVSRDGTLAKPTMQLKHLLRPSRTREEYYHRLRNRLLRRSRLRPQGPGLRRR